MEDIENDLKMSSIYIMCIEEIKCFFLMCSLKIEEALKRSGHKLQVPLYMYMYIIVGTVIPAF